MANVLTINPMTVDGTTSFDITAGRKTTVHAILFSASTTADEVVIGDNSGNLVYRQKLAGGPLCWHTPIDFVAGNGLKVTTLSTGAKVLFFVGMPTNAS